MKDKLKLYVWKGEGVLQDHTSGMICVLASSFEEAINLIAQKCDWCMQSFPVTKYKVIEKPEAFICRGGG